MKRLIRVLMLGVVLYPASAFAHSPIEGVGEFYNGLLHPILVYTQLLSLVALGLWLGYQPKKQRATSLVGLALCCTLGLVLTPYVDENAMEVLPLFSATLLGTALMYRLVTPAWLTIIVASGTGLLIGLDSSQPLLYDTALLLSHIGNLLGVVLLVVNIVMLSQAAKKVWQQIAMRIAGSWISACAILSLFLVHVGIT
ncbi:HupE/UreJ family protein [Vibrio methylphosphonaticus]|uniref:HupE/UreJ family protein n=1 Tax=Vibrio methylphosphonaticus TaxID=2946866 RepID=UPI00202A4E64|nr:HupE/UreJ family protein [Vibrio methylphosphonaticus]MCL9774013.1 HupE/UreJ family protein [Vibrio methylphosphonaticus]